MVVMSLPATIPNFEGNISHVVIAGNETLAFIKPSTRAEQKARIRAKIFDLTPTLQKIKSLSGVKSGEVYLVKVKHSFQRSCVIRRPTPDNFSIYLIDKGMQCEVSIDEIYEIPKEMLEFNVFGCICPVLVPSAEKLSAYKPLLGLKCRCEVEGITKSGVVMGFVRGHLLVEMSGRYEELTKLIKVADGTGKASGRESPFSIKALWPVAHNGAYDDSSSSSSESDAHVCKVPPSGRVSGLFPLPGEGEYLTLGREQRGTRPDAEYLVHFDRMRGGSLFSHTAFKQYKPNILPVSISARFEKTDRMMSTFWVVNKAIFSAVDQALTASADKLVTFPSVRTVGEIRMKETPCVVYVRADSAYKAFYRGVPAQYDANTKRFSIFLVDFGWFKWVLPYDIIDISGMDQSDPLLTLPVSMLHCREDPSSVIHVKDLYRGMECEITIKGPAIRGVYTVAIMPPPQSPPNLPRMSPNYHAGPNRLSQSPAYCIEPIRNNQSPVSESVHINQPAANLSAIPSVQSISNTPTVPNTPSATNNETENDMLACRKMIAEACQRQLMASIMMESMHVANRAQQMSNNCYRPDLCPPNYSPMPMPMPMAMMMPIAVPVFMPMQHCGFSNTNTTVGQPTTGGGLATTETGSGAGFQCNCGNHFQLFIGNPCQHNCGNTFQRNSGNPYPHNNGNNNGNTSQRNSGNGGGGNGIYRGRGSGISRGGKNGSSRGGGAGFPRGGGFHGNNGGFHHSGGNFPDTNSRSRFSARASFGNRGHRFQNNPPSPKERFAFASDMSPKDAILPSLGEDFPKSAASTSRNEATTNTDSESTQAKRTGCEKGDAADRAVRSQSDNQSDDA